MVPKTELKAWRLQTEERHMKIKGKRRTITALVLRNEHGLVKRVAKSPSEQAELKRWYRNYNKTTRTEDLPASKTLRRKLGLIIGKLKKRGFIYRELCYGTTWNKKTGKREYKRMEVFKATPWTQRERGRIWYFFKAHMPKSNLGIYVIQQNKLYMYPLNR